MSVFFCSLIHHHFLLSPSHFPRTLPNQLPLPSLHPSQDPNPSLAHLSKEPNLPIRSRCLCITFPSHHQLSILPCTTWDCCQCMPSRSLPHPGLSMAQWSTLHQAMPPAWTIPASSLHNLLPDLWQSLAPLVMDTGLVLWLQIPWWTTVQWGIRVTLPFLLLYLSVCRKVRWLAYWLNLGKCEDMDGWQAVFVEGQHRIKVKRVGCGFRLLGFEFCCLLCGFGQLLNLCAFVSSVK